MQSNDKCSSFHNLNMVPLLIPFDCPGCCPSSSRTESYPGSQPWCTGMRAPKWSPQRPTFSGRPFLIIFLYMCAMNRNEVIYQGRESTVFLEGLDKYECLWAPLNYSCPWSWRSHIHLGGWFAGDDMNQYEIIWYWHWFAPEPTNLHGNVLELSKLQLSHALFHGSRSTWVNNIVISSMLTS